MHDEEAGGMCDIGTRTVHDVCSSNAGVCVGGDVILMLSPYSDEDPDHSAFFAMSLEEAEILITRMVRACQGARARRRELTN